MIHSAPFATFYQYRDLLGAWTVRTIRARYKQSLLGGLWAVLQPAATVAIFTVIFTVVVPIDTDGVPYVIFAYTAMVPWVLFSASVTDMVDSLVANMNLVSKIYFPREVLPVAALLARLLDFLIAATVLVLLMLYYQMIPSLPGLLFLPVILAIQLALALGIGLAGAALNVFYRDMKHLFVLGLQLWLYATPIIYPVALVPERFRSLYFLNPMAGAVEGYRAVLLHNSLPGAYLLASAVTAMTVLVAGYWFFKRVEFQFSDVV
jgi:lipopolysaccharide transport system permease protein